MMPDKHYWVTSNISVQNSFQKSVSSVCYLFYSWSFPLLNLQYILLLLTFKKQNELLLHLHLSQSLAPSLISSAFSLSTVNH